VKYRYFYCLDVDVHITDVTDYVVMPCRYVTGMSINRAGGESEQEWMEEVMEKNLPLPRVFRQALPRYPCNAGNQT